MRERITSVLQPTQRWCFIHALLALFGAQHLVAVAVNVENRASFVFIEDFRIDNNDSTI
ncbi:hypothetical protein SLEP1_g47523 [Rubroshorea leprosula]|uniref:Uncharacterized protein n=1 Tax=Rubroshorea leprosula TaxID=152421 RepID=A0AAV5LSZ0_9ROSI|nr:hypothetical protein SLEP1_g47523 [Rubroshorea leprosula]